METIVWTSMLHFTTCDNLAIPSLTMQGDVPVILLFFIEAWTTLVTSETIDSCVNGCVIVPALLFCKRFWTKFTLILDSLMFIHVNFVGIVAVVAFATLLTIKVKLSSMELLVFSETCTGDKFFSTFGARVFPFLFADFIRFERCIHARFLIINREGNVFNFERNKFP